MNEMTENKYPYDNWKSIIESDFVTLFIKTWVAFVSTLREMYPAEIPYYQATGDSRYISPYKKEFSQNIAYKGFQHLPRHNRFYCPCAVVNL